jgi:very-short-patch-repair endonuclease
MPSTWKRAIDPILLERARAMRHQSALAEQKLWHFLRDRQLGGHKFRRQHVVAPFIADFYCHALKLIVELDGDSHGDREAYDHQRTVYLTRDGFHVVRFLNDDVFHHLDAVLEAILDECEQLAANCPSP